MVQYGRRSATYTSALCFRYILLVAQDIVLVLIYISTSAANLSSFGGGGGDGVFSLCAR